MNYAKSTRQFLTTIIRQRMVLITNGYSRKNEQQMHNMCTNLLRLLETYPYATNKLMASFVLRHQWQIESILPGAGSNCTDQCSTLFNTMVEQATEITNINQPAEIHQQ